MDAENLLLMVSNVQLMLWLLVKNALLLDMVMLEKVQHNHFVVWEQELLSQKLIQSTLFKLLWKETDRLFYIGVLQK